MKSRIDARKYKRSEGARAPKSAISRSMARYSLRSLVQKELAAALKPDLKSLGQVTDIFSILILYLFCRDGL
jgi:hypothetical protein